MEFKFRATDDRKPPCRSSPSPSSSFFSEPALRFDHPMDPDFMHNSRDFYAIQRKIEKERIRHEIITAENVHRRLLEEEVRRELMMEREMVRASKMSLAIDERLSMQVPASCWLMHPLNNRWLEDRFAFPGNHGMGFGHDAPSPSLLQFSDTAKEEITSTLEVNKKDKLIMLSKPNPNLCGSNQKAATAPAGSGELPLMSSKKPTEWSCTLCQVSATCEKGLNEHRQGKKHKAKEAGLIRTQRVPNHSTSSMSNKSAKKIKLTESRESADREIKTKVEEESVEAMVGLDLKMEGVEHSENKNAELPKEDLDEKPWMKKGILTAEKMKIKVPNRKNFKFWCEDCQVGTHSAVVMEGHKRGKKHTSRCNESKPNSAAVLGNTSVRIMAPCEPTEKAEDEDAVAAEGNEETTVIVTEKPEDEEVIAEEASEETMENFTEKVEDEDVVAKEVKEETAENVTGKSDGTGSYIVGDAVDVTKQTP